MKYDLDVSLEYTAMECLDITVKAGNKSLRLVSIYRPPPSTKNILTSSMFFNDFSRLEDLSTSQTGCLLSGDFHFHMNACSPEAELFQELINSADQHQHVTFPTHTKDHTLDLVITTCGENIVSRLCPSFELPSDHASITCCLNLPRPPLIEVNSKRRRVRNIDLYFFVKYLSRLECKWYTIQIPIILR